ncbi:MAG: DUF2147 domain-containing protein [Chitinophagaceae bacterium]|nr:MAG: DUF2147 domain-containing protein [Chitinophagaceae bacterium]
MKKSLILFVTIVLSIAALAQQPADKIIGTWESVDSDVKLKFEFFRSDGKYFGKLLHASNMYEGDGKTPKSDSKNPDPKLRSRSRYGIINITNLVFDDGEYSGGNLYNPEEGRTYRLKAELTGPNDMDFRGYMGISLLGKTMKFKRVQ